MAHYINYMGLTAEVTQDIQDRLNRLHDNIPELTSALAGSPDKEVAAQGIKDREAFLSWLLCLGIESLQRAPHAPSEGGV